MSLFLYGKPQLVNLGGGGPYLIETTDKLTAIS